MGRGSCSICVWKFDKPANRISIFYCITVKQEGLITAFDIPYTLLSYNNTFYFAFPRVNTNLAVQY